MKLFRQSSGDRRVVLMCLVLSAPAGLLAQQPAFPGAGGGGAQSSGGRGGAVYEVTNLDDSGPGSLRYGVEGSGARTIVFRVAGTIEITSAIQIRNPFITIAGQTAPGGGIQVIAPNSRDSMFWIDTVHDVTIRYLRLRHGYNAQADQTGDPVAIGGGNHIIVDHCTLMWTTDQNTNAWAGRVPVPSQVTWSWNLLAEPLASHPTNLITGGSNHDLSGAVVDLDAHHNLLANSSHRNPLVKNKNFRFVNNIVYNWRFRASHVAGGVEIDFIGNVYKPGPLDGPEHEMAIYTEPGGEGDAAPGVPSVYVLGNMGPSNPDPDADNWPMVWELADGENGNLVGPLSASYRRDDPLPALPVPIPVDPAEDLEALVLPTVGASQRLDCLGNWVPNRDTTDLRILDEVHAGAGIIPATEDEVGGFPDIADGEPCPDSDHDGMPDAFEAARGFDPDDPADGAQDRDGDGYTNLEDYLNGGSGDRARPSAPTGLHVAG